MARTVLGFFDANSSVNAHTFSGWSFHSCCVVTAVSRGTRAILLRWVDLPPHRVRVLPDTVQDKYVPGPASAALREKLALGPGPILLTVGRMSAGERYKGHEQVFRALPTGRTRHPTLVHVVAGGGDDRAYLEQRALELAGPGVVRFLGFVPEEELLDLYRLADLYVMPSTQEGFGIAYLEAAGCGVRVVGGVGGGSADAVPERVGALVDPSDRDALAATIRTSSAAARRSGGRRALRRKHFGVQRRGARWPTSSSRDADGAPHLPGDAWQPAANHAS